MKANLARKKKKFLKIEEKKYRKTEEKMTKNWEKNDENPLRK